MKRILSLIIVLGLAGLAAGYALFGKTGGQYVGIDKLLFPPQNILQSLGDKIAGLEKIRQSILICGAVGAGLGLVLGLSTGRRR